MTREEAVAELRRINADPDRPTGLVAVLLHTPDYSDHWVEWLGTGVVLEP